MNLTFFVAGVPAPQGSKTSYGRGRIVDSADTGKVKNAGKMWSEAVRMEAIKAMAGRAPLEGPVEVDMQFYLARPKHHYAATGRVKVKFLDAAHAIRPDRLKLARRVEDALTGVVYKDDAQAWGGDVWKFWTTGDPGVRISVTGGTSPPPTP